MNELEFTLGFNRLQLHSSLFRHALDLMLCLNLCEELPCEEFISSRTTDSVNLSYPDCNLFFCLEIGNPQFSRKASFKVDRRSLL